MGFVSVEINIKHIQDNLIEVLIEVCMGTKVSEINFNHRVEEGFVRRQYFSYTSKNE